MRIRRSVQLAARPDAVRRTLTDAETFLRCLPGATSETADDGAAEGRFLIRIGGHQITYAGQAQCSGDERIVWRASAAQIRGEGEVAATLTFTTEADEVGSTLAVDARFSGAGRVAELDAEARRKAGERLLERLLQGLARETRPVPAVVPVDPPVERPEPATVLAAGTVPGAGTAPVVAVRGRVGLPVLAALVASIGLFLVWMLRRLNVRH